MSFVFRNPVYSFGYVSINSTFKIAAFILAVIIAIILFALLLNKKENEEIGGFKGFLYNFFNFKTYCIDKVLKVLFTLIFIYNLIYGCLQIFINPLNGLLYLIVYNLILRLIFEFIMLFVDIKKNTDKKCNCNCDCDCNCDCNCDTCNCEIEDIDLDAEDTEEDNNEEENK